uniref:Signal transducer CD24 n=1 Tax=Equus caballus TaxID=9796 RepID=A0A9L0RII2_HORSE
AHTAWRTGDQNTKRAAGGGGGRGPEHTDCSEPWRPAPASPADQPAKSTRGAAPSPRQARGPHKARTVPLPLGWEFENSRAEGAPGPGPRATRAAVRAVGGGCAPHPRRRLLFRWVRWQVWGNKGNLGPAPGAGCGAREFAPGPAWLSPGAFASLHAARSGTHKAPGREPAAPAAHLQPGDPGISQRPRARAAAAAEGGGAGEPEGAGAGGRALGGRWRRRRGARVGGSHVTAIVAVLVYKGPLAGPALHLSCAGPEPAVLHAPSFQRYVSRADGVDMGRAMVARLGLGLLLLALLLPTQIYSNQTTVATTSSNSSQSTSAAPNPATATTHSNGGTLQSTASLFVISFSLLHLYC